MRIWSLHPEHLDAKGLVALWRETLLARKVLQGRTKGYRSHPQLIRFTAMENPLEYVDFYLLHVWKEAVKRNYKFDQSKFNQVSDLPAMPVTEGQVQFEFRHLLKKLEKRAPDKYTELKVLDMPNVHPLFRVVQGSVEEWEVL